MLAGEVADRARRPADARGFYARAAASGEPHVQAAALARLRCVCGY
jgi:hypothetical protein